LRLLHANRARTKHPQLHTRAKQQLYSAVLNSEVLAVLHLERRMITVRGVDELVINVNRSSLIADSPGTRANGARLCNCQAAAEKR
jgi:hypothetical protein